MSAKALEHLLAFDQYIYDLRPLSQSVESFFVIGFVEHFIPSRFTLQ